MGRVETMEMMKKIKSLWRIKVKNYCWVDHLKSNNSSLIGLVFDIYSINQCHPEVTEPVVLHIYERERQNETET